MRPPADPDNDNDAAKSPTQTNFRPPLRSRDKKQRILQIVIDNSSGISFADLHTKFNSLEEISEPNLKQFLESLYQRKILHYSGDVHLNNIVLGEKGHTITEKYKGNIRCYFLLNPDISFFRWAESANLNYPSVSAVAVVALILLAIVGATVTYNLDTWPWKNKPQAQQGSTDPGLVAHFDADAKSPMSDTAKEIEHQNQLKTDTQKKAEYPPILQPYSFHDDRKTKPKGSESHLQPAVNPTINQQAQLAQDVSSLFSGLQHDFENEKGTMLAPGYWKSSKVPIGATGCNIYTYGDDSLACVTQFYFGSNEQSAIISFNDVDKAISSLGERKIENAPGKYEKIIVHSKDKNAILIRFKRSGTYYVFLSIQKGTNVRHISGLQ